MKKIQIILNNKLYYISFTNRDIFIRIILENSNSYSFTIFIHLI